MMNKLLEQEYPSMGNSINGIDIWEKPNETNTPYYDKDEDRIVLPKAIIERQLIDADYESIFEGATEMVKSAFGLNHKHIIGMEKLSQNEKDAIRSKVKKFFKTYKQAPGGVLTSGHNQVKFENEFRKLLRILAIGNFFTVKRGKKEYGVRPILPYHCQVGGVKTPWHLLYIDFMAQRGTDAMHLIDKLMNFDSMRNMGLTGRVYDNGHKVDINDGRHSAMLAALSGMPYVYVRGPNDDNRVTNMNIFEVLNSLAKPITRFNEMTFMYSRSLLTLKEKKDLSYISTKNQVTGNGLYTSDKKMYELFELAKEFDFTLVPDTYKNSTALEGGHLWQTSQFNELFDNRYRAYTQFDEDQNIVDSFLRDACEVVQEAYTSQGGYADVVTMWPICENLFIASEKNGLTQKNREQMKHAMTQALTNYLPEVNPDTPRKMVDRAGLFYTAVKKLKNSHNNQSSELKDVAGGNAFIQHWLSTALYSLVQEDPSISKNVKALFVMPQFNQKQQNADGEEDIVIRKLEVGGKPVSLSTLKQNNVEVVDA